MDKSANAGRDGIVVEPFAGAAVGRGASPPVKLDVGFAEGFVSGLGVISTTERLLKSTGLEWGLDVLVRSVGDAGKEFDGVAGAFVEEVVGLVAVNEVGLTAPGLAAGAFTTGLGSDASPDGMPVGVAGEEGFTSRAATRASGVEPGDNAADGAAAGPGVEGDGAVGCFAALATPVVEVDGLLFGGIVTCSVGDEEAGDF